MLPIANSLARMFGFQQRQPIKVTWEAMSSQTWHARPHISAAAHTRIQRVNLSLDMAVARAISGYMRTCSPRALEAASISPADQGG